MHYLLNHPAILKQQRVQMQISGSRPSLTNMNPLCKTLRGLSAHSHLAGQQLKANEFLRSKPYNQVAPRFKARFVAKGYSQVYGLDYVDTFSPVVKHYSLRTVLAIAAAKDLEMIQLDIKTAFLNGDL